MELKSVVSLCVLIILYIPTLFLLCIAILVYKGNGTVLGVTMEDYKERDIIATIIFLVLVYIGVGTLIIKLI